MQAPDLLMIYQEDQLLQGVLDHQALMPWMGGCQEQMMSCLGIEDDQGRVGHDGGRFHPSTQNSIQFKTYEMENGIFHLTFSNHG